MKTKTVWIGCILAALFCGRAANASVIITLDQVGPNVDAMANGTVDLTDLDFDDETATVFPGINPNTASLIMGGTGTFIDAIPLYSGISGPESIGSAFNLPNASATTGSELVFFGATPAQIGVPVGYVSGMPLDATATWDNTTLAALGLTPVPAIYTWTWGTGDHADSLTLDIGFAPEPAPALLLTLGAAGLALLKWGSSMRNRKA